MGFLYQSNVVTVCRLASAYFRLRRGGLVDGKLMNNAKYLCVGIFCQKTTLCHLYFSNQKTEKRFGSVQIIIAGIFV